MKAAYSVSWKLHASLLSYLFLGDGDMFRISLPMSSEYLVSIRWPRSAERWLLMPCVDIMFQACVRCFSAETYHGNVKLQLNTHFSSVIFICWCRFPHLHFLLSMHGASWIAKKCNPEKQDSSAMHINLRYSIPEPHKIIWKRLIRYHGNFKLQLPWCLFV